MDASNGEFCTQPWFIHGSAAAQTLPESQRCASLAAFLAESASLAPLLILQTLQRLAFCDEAGWEIAQRRAEFRIAEAYQPLLTRWHHLLLEEGLLECEEEQWFLSDCAPGEAQLAQRIDDARHRLRQLMSWLDDARPLAEALFSEHERIDDWLYAPQLVQNQAELPGLHQLLHHDGILGDYFGGITASVLPALLAHCSRPSVLAIGAVPASQTCCLADSDADWHHAAGDTTSDADVAHDAAIGSELFSHPDVAATLARLHLLIKPGAPLLLLETVQERPLHWATAPAVSAQARHARPLPPERDAETEARLAQTLEQAGFELLQVWPQRGTAMDFCGQRLLIARRPQAASTLHSDGT